MNDHSTNPTETPQQAAPAIEPTSPAELPFIKVWTAEEALRLATLGHKYHALKAADREFWVFPASASADYQASEAEQEAEAAMRLSVGEYGWAKLDERITPQWAAWQSPPAAAQPAGPSVNTLGELRERIGKWLHIPPEDAEVVDYALAVLKSNEMPGDPVWGLIIDASGGGKTELLRSLRGRSDCYFVSSLTEKSLVSGYRDPKHPERDPSLLPELMGKTLVIKDMSPMLSMDRKARDKIIGDLRDAYDGFSDHNRGNIGRVSYEGQFSVVAASTLAVERYQSVDQELGERFLKFRCHSPETAQKIKRALCNMGRDRTMREDIGAAVKAYLSTLPRLTEMPRLPDSMLDRLATISDFVAKARSHVARDSKHELRYLPRPEVGTRLVKELGKLLVALAVVRGKELPDEEDLKTIERVAWDCIPPNRALVLRALQSWANGVPTTAAIADSVGLAWTTVKTTLSDLAVLGLVRKEGAVFEDEQYQSWALADVA